MSVIFIEPPQDFSTSKVRTLLPAGCVIQA